MSRPTVGINVEDLKLISTRVQGEGDQNYTLWEYLHGKLPRGLRQIAIFPTPPLSSLRALLVSTVDEEIIGVFAKIPAHLNTDIGRLEGSVYCVQVMTYTIVERFAEWLVKTFPLEVDDEDLKY